MLPILYVGASIEEFDDHGLRREVFHLTVAVHGSIIPPIEVREVPPIEVREARV
jgi:hypothetical protein